MANASPVGRRGRRGNEETDRRNNIGRSIPIQGRRRSAQADSSSVAAVDGRTANAPGNAIRFRLSSRRYVCIAPAATVTSVAPGGSRHCPYPLDASGYGRVRQSRPSRFAGLCPPRSTSGTISGEYSARKAVVPHHHWPVRPSAGRSRRSQAASTHDGCACTRALAVVGPTAAVRGYVKTQRTKGPVSASQRNQLRCAWFGIGLWACSMHLPGPPSAALIAP